MHLSISGWAVLSMPAADAAPSAQVCHTSWCEVSGLWRHATGRWPPGRSLVRRVGGQAGNMVATIVCAGDRLARQGEHLPGAGTHVKDGVIYASIVGYQTTRSQTEQEASNSGNKALQVVEVTAAGSRMLVPSPGDTVTVKIMRVQQTSANCNIMCVGSHALTAEFRGTIRQQDVRATEIDKVVMYDCFRPGDIVRAQVLSLGDARSFYLTTAQDSLGVVYAKSVAGFEMVANDWTSMRCTQTQAVEKRKVAKTS